MILKVVFRSIGRVPRRWQGPLAGFLGRLWFLADKRHRNIALDNLRRAYKDEMGLDDAQLLAKENFKNFMLFFLEMCWAMNQDREELVGYFDTEQSRYMKEALEKNKGLLVLTGHLGNWEFLTYATAFEGLKGNAVYRPLDFEPMDRFVKQLRCRFGTGMIPVRGSVEKIRKVLDDNQAVGLLMDQNADFGNGVVIDFFGRRAVGNKGLAILALKTGAPVVPAFLVREGGKFKLVSGPEIPLIKTGDKRKDVELNTQQYNRVIERFVRAYPEQWFWVHNKWKTRPSSPWPRQ